MERKCYIVEMNSALEGLFEQLNDYGFDYWNRWYTDWCICGGIYAWLSHSSSQRAKG